MSNNKSIVHGFVSMKTKYIIVYSILGILGLALLLLVIPVNIKTVRTQTINVSDSAPIKVDHINATVDYYGMPSDWADPDSSVDWDSLYSFEADLMDSYDNYLTDGNRVVDESVIQNLNAVPAYDYYAHTKHSYQKTTQQATDVYGLHWNYSDNNDHDTSKIVQSNDKSYIPIYLDIDCHYKEGKYSRSRDLHYKLVPNGNKYTMVSGADD